nr:MAG: hypothetical protein [Bacteriophage sp.]
MLALAIVVHPQHHTSKSWGAYKNYQSSGVSIGPRGEPSKDKLV